MTTLAELIFQTAKPDNYTLEEYQEILVASGIYTSEQLNRPVDEKKKATPPISPRSVNHEGHRLIRESLTRKESLSDVIRFLVSVFYSAIEKEGGELDVELKQKWESKVDPLLKQLSSVDRLKVIQEWLGKALTLGDIGSKTMNAYLRTSKIHTPTENLENDNESSFFPEEEV